MLASNILLYDVIWMFCIYVSFFAKDITNAMMKENGNNLADITRHYFLFFFMEIPKILLRVFSNIPDELYFFAVFFEKY